MRKEAILHVPLSKFAYALDEHTLTIRMRCGKDDLRECILCCGDRACEKDPILLHEIFMERVGCDGLFDYYEVTFESEYTRVCYFFRLISAENETLFYSEYGFSEKPHENRTWFFQFPYLRREDIITSCDWVEGMVLYHIFPDSFADGKRHIAGEGREIALANGQLCKNRNGGTLNGILRNLDYLKDQGINCLYLNPIFAAASYHKYDTIDYYEVDPCFGTKEDLKNLVKACHENGIRVLLDGVFNHCGSGFFAFKDILEKGEDSPYKDWFYRLSFPIAYETPPNYEAFAYVREMPKLNTGNPQVIDYFCRVGQYWILEAGIDGWRLDVANEVNHDFWRAFRKAVKEVKEDAFLIAEIWEDADVWLMGDQFDSAMNYRFSNICLDFFAKRNIGVTAFDERVQGMLFRYPMPVARMQMNFLDTHDIPRFFTFCEGDERRMKLAVLFLFTAVGIPSVFYGDEKCLTGIKEGEYRSPMPWDEEALTVYYRKLAAIRSRYKALSKGDYRTILADEQKQVYAFARNYEEQSIYVLFNVGEDAQEVTLGGGKERLLDLMQAEVLEDQTVSCGGMRGKIFLRM